MAWTQVFQNPRHYASVFNTLATMDNGILREVDDFATRAAIKRLFEDCTIFSTDSERSGTQLSKLEPRSGNEVEHTVGQEIRQVP